MVITARKKANYQVPKPDMKIIMWTQRKLVSHTAIYSKFFQHFSIAQAIDVLTKTYEEISKDNAEFTKKEGLDKFFAIFRGLSLDVSLEDRMVYLIFNSIFTVNLAKEIVKNSTLLKILFEVNKF